MQDSGNVSPVFRGGALCRFGSVSFVVELVFAACADAVDVVT